MGTILPEVYVNNKLIEIHSISTKSHSARLPGRGQEQSANLRKRLTPSGKSSWRFLRECDIVNLWAYAEPDLSGFQNLTGLCGDISFVRKPNLYIFNRVQIANPSLNSKFVSFLQAKSAGYSYPSELTV